MANSFSGIHKSKLICSAEDDLPRLAKYRLTTSRNCPGHGTSITVILCHHQVNLLNLKRGLPKVIFRGRAIPACCKPELIGIYKLTFWELKNAGNHVHLAKPYQKSLKGPKREYSSPGFLLKPGL